MAVPVDRVAGLDIGKGVVVVCARTPGPKGKRASEILTCRTMNAVAGGDGGLAGRVRGDDGGDGVDGDAHMKSVQVASPM